LSYIAQKVIQGHGGYKYTLCMHYLWCCSLKQSVSRF